MIKAVKEKVTSQMSDARSPSCNPSVAGKFERRLVFLEERMAELLRVQQENRKKVPAETKEQSTQIMLTGVKLEALGDIINGLFTDYIPTEEER